MMFDIKFDWKVLEELSEILTPLFEATEILSGSKYPTIGSVISTVKGIEDLLTVMKPKTEAVKMVKESLLENIEFRFQGYSDLQLISLFFDPRFKLDGLPEYLNFNECLDRIKNFLRKYSVSNEEEEVIETRPNSLKGLIFKKPKMLGSLDDEITQYLSQPALTDESMNIFSFWQNSSYKKLKKISTCVLNCQATSVSAERIFSKSGTLLTKRRNNLSNTTICTLMSLNNWID